MSSISQLDREGVVVSTTELKRTEQEGERVEKLLEGERSMWGA